MDLVLAGLDRQEHGEGAANGPHVTSNRVLGTVSDFAGLSGVEGGKRSGTWTLL